MASKLTSDIKVYQFPFNFLVNDVFYLITKLANNEIMANDDDLCMR